MKRSYTLSPFPEDVNRWVRENKEKDWLEQRTISKTKKQGKVDIFLPFKRAWRYFLRQEARARVAFIKEFYPEATGADLERAAFYRDMLQALTGGMLGLAVLELFVICFE